MNKPFLNLIFSALLAVLVAHLAKAQTPNFSMYQYSPVFTNPGATGTIEDIRLMANYRKQQVDLNENFSSSAFTSYFPIYFGQNRLVITGSFLNDKSSDLYSTNGGILGFAYNIQTNPYSSLSLGIQAGYFQGKIGGSYSTDDQYVDGSYNPNVASSDAIFLNTANYSTISTGLYYHINDYSNREKAFVGFSVFNLNEPNIATTDGEEDHLALSLKATAGYRIFQGTKLAIIPTGRIVSQAGNTFLNLGSKFSYELDNAHQNKLELGVWYHTNSYGIVSLAFEKENLTIAASYDKPMGINLQQAVNGIVELGISFRLKAKKATKKQEVVTPVEELITEEEETPIEQITPDPEQEMVAEANEQEETNDIDISETKLTPQEEATLAQTVRFELNSYNLDSDSKRFLNEVAGILSKKESVSIELVGHSCSLGAESINTKISLERADAVKKYLLENGIPEQRISISGMGESNPIADNQTEEGRQLNRRVEFKVVYLK